MSTLSTVRAALAADIPVKLEGAPGTGKTAVIEAMAAEAGAHLEVLIGSTLDPTDLGYLIPEGGTLKIAPPPWALRLADALKRGVPAWWFLDEFSCSPPSVQASLLRGVHDRMIGDTSIRGCRVLAAMNPVEQAAAGYDLPPAAANRWLHVSWAPDPGAWVDGMLAGWGKPQDETLAASRGLVASFVRRHPSALLDFPKDASQQGKAWPSPRTWDHLSRFLAALGAPPTQAAQSEDGAAGADGLVGRHASSEWLRWLSEVDLADPEDYLSGKVKLPERGDRLAAALDSIVVAALKDIPERPKRIARAGEICAEARKDVGWLAAASMIRAMPQSLYKLLPPAILDIHKQVTQVRA